MSRNWIKKCVWLCLIAISNPVIYATAMIPIGPHSMAPPVVEMIMDHGSTHDHSLSMAASQHGELAQADETDCCKDHCDCGVLGCRVQTCSLNTPSFHTSGSQDAFESPQNHYALNFPSGLYRPPSFHV